MQRPTLQAAPAGKGLLRMALAVTLGLTTVVGLVIGFLFYGLPALSELREMQERAGTMRNIEKIASAMSAYAVDHGTYPPAIIRDSAGKPMHSWRVLLLPYLNQNELHDQYNFDKPWDAPENAKLASLMPDVYYAQASTHGGLGYEACYQLVTGPGTLIPATGPLQPDSYLDDPAKTALVVEGFCGNVNMGSVGTWLEPTELDITKMTGQIGSATGVEIGGITPGGAAIATADGRSHFLSETMAPDLVLAILTANGNEPLADDVLD